MQLTTKIRDEYEALFKSIGADGFFKHVLGVGSSARKHLDYPEITMLDQAESFFALYRSTGNCNYFAIGKILRRVAHKLYRDGRKKIEKYPSNRRFLSVIPPSNNSA